MNVWKIICMSIINYNNKMLSFKKKTSKNNFQPILCMFKKLIYIFSIIYLKLDI